MLRLRLSYVLPMAMCMASCGGGGGGAVPSTSIDAASAIVHGPRYAAVRLPRDFVPYAMMRDGRVTGSVGRDAAIFFRNRITKLGTFGSEFSTATFVNAHGDAVGFSMVDPSVTISPPGRALYFSGGSVQELHGLPGSDFSAARAIDDDGDIYGGSGSKDNSFGPRSLTLVRFSRSGIAAATSPSIVYNDESDQRFIWINSRGDFVATRAGNGGPTLDLGFEGHGSTIAPILASARASTGIGVNDDGDVVGAIARQTSPHGEPVGTTYIRTGTSTRYLPSLANLHQTQSAPIGINDRDDVVGTVFTATQSVNFVYTHGKMYALASLLNAPLTLFLGPHGVSNDGAFIAQSSDNAYYIVEPVDLDD